MRRSNSIFIECKNCTSVNAVVLAVPIPRQHLDRGCRISDEEWAFAAPYLTLMDPQARQRKYDLRLMFNALRWMARAGA
ncbi:MAG TPA: transposase, partial [Pseudoxanthomonas sp.]|nr:transposase [Pseudoxanthomonas sp.]